MVAEGLLLTPRSPETQNGRAAGRGPAPTLSLLVRELPTSGMLQITVEAARYDDGWQPSVLADESVNRLELDIAAGAGATLNLTSAGVYQIDVVLQGPPQDDVMTIDVGNRTFSNRLNGAHEPDENGEVAVPLLVARFEQGEFSVKVGNGDGKNIRRVLLTAIAADSETGKQFAAFEKRVPYLSTHMGLRTDVGARLTRFAEPKPVPSAKVERYSFVAPISSFASPDTEEGNANYLAGLREIGVRSEPTDGRQMPRVLVRAIEIEGPYFESWPTYSHSKMFFASANMSDPSVYAREILSRFAMRAYRRPPVAEELDSLWQIWRESYSRNGEFQQSIKHALLVVLTSPQFLLLTEESDSPDPEPLTPHELAAKLSYFLWDTTPDDQLQTLANKGELSDCLRSEIDRMVMDERFEQFSNEFVSQWLSLDKFDVVNVNHRKYRRLKREVKRELRQEPIHFVRHLIRENLPLSNLMDSNFIVANEVVAGYYGIGSRADQGYRFVPVRHGSENLGGLLSQAAILSGLSDGNESNPVKRGAWLARKIIAEPLEPPPPNVPELSDEEEAGTLRERLEQHRNQKGCANCHQKIDPWGLPLEQFDAGGLFKTKQVDVSSVLPDATEITNANELKRYLAEDRIDQVAYSFLMHLATYATGRSMSFNELEFLRIEGKKQLKENGYRMKDCVRFVVESPMFLEK